MRFENEGMSLWFGTPDAPSPSETVPIGTVITITVAVNPGNRSNKVEVLFWINKGSAERVTASWLRNDARANVQYFRAQFTPCVVGDTVEYIPVCRCAGRTVPTEDDIASSRSIFHIVETSTKTLHNTLPTKAEPTAHLGNGNDTPTVDTTMASMATPQLGTQQPSNPSLGSTKEFKDGDSTSTNAKTQSTETNSKEASTEAKVTSPHHEIRINTLSTMLSTNEERQAVRTEFLAAKGDWTAAFANLKDNSDLAPISIRVAKGTKIWKKGRKK